MPSILFNSILSSVLLLYSNRFPCSFALSVNNRIKPYQTFRSEPSSKASTSTPLYSMKADDQSKSVSKEIYNIPGSGWASDRWNWGYAVGTGHDCALICRRRWGTRDVRIELINALSNPIEINQEGDSLSIHDADESRDPPFEEVKLILALAWQNGRWDGSDGGLGGYGDVLRYMADAQRYESNDETMNSKVLVKDMVKRFHLICLDDKELEEMKSLEETAGNDIDKARRKCAAKVLSAMGFIEKGL